MPTGAITEYVNVAQVTLYLFWIFFFLLILYLHRENKREGYPLDTGKSGRRGIVQGFPAMPPAKHYLLHHGGTATVSDGKLDLREIKALPTGNFFGAPLEPTGNPMVDGVGPAAWAERADEPDLTFEGHVKIVPLRVAGDWKIASRNPDPRGMRVVARDDKIAGTVVDVWVDRAEITTRYLEVEVPLAEGETKHVLLPMTLVRVSRMSREATGDGSVPIGQRLIGGRPHEIRVDCVCAHHFADAPVRQNPDQVTLLEEDRTMAYFGSGHLYAMDRREPLI